MDVNSLSHSRWECKYHVVFAPTFYTEKEPRTNHLVRQPPFAYFCRLSQLLEVLIKPIMQQASKRLSGGCIIMLPAASGSFYCDIYKGYLLY